MITIISGEPGMGKGVYSMFLLRELVAQGRPVFTNIRLRPECPFESRCHILDDDANNFPVYDEETHAAWWDYVPRGAAVVIDEGDNYFDCQEHSKLAKRCKVHHKQHRKYKQDIFYIVQNPSNLYVRIRRMASRYVLCEWNWRTFPKLQAVARFLPLPGWFEFWRGMSSYNRLEFSGYPFTGRNYLGMGGISYRNATQFFQWYDTEQIIGEPTYARRGSDSEASESGTIPSIGGDHRASEASEESSPGVVVGRRRRRGSVVVAAEVSDSVNSGGGGGGASGSGVSDSILPAF